ncbi:hypothetical protein [Andreprevotia sp. IGB-42]|uniref:hypothetical protein n=1 Tax=Andreprevotia sp. IGB-42 TaxID=2497473 RepID=UPI00191E332B|nr:hypothetical protein [Andreprevotia sp. IGB-42]
MNHLVAPVAGPLVADIDADKIAVGGGKIMLKDEASRHQWLVALQRYCLSRYAFPTRTTRR